VRRIGEAHGIVEYHLKNGLKILLKENHSAPVVSFMVVYRVGSRNEAVGHTGSTHFLEHMMFKGTRKFNPAKGNGVMEMLARIGALRNATTWLDRTNYFECGGAEHLPLYVELEADRMRGLLLRQEDRDSEMTVVRNEFERGENDPGSALSKELTAIAFREHPYHHPTIGWRTDVEGVPMERMKEFYDTYYFPNNATVIVVGDFVTDDCLRLIAKHFGPIPRSPHALPAVYTVEPPQEGERRFELKRAGDLPQLSIGYHATSASHVDSYALSALSHILGGAHKRSSRLYKRLMETGLVTGCSASNGEFRDPGLFELDATLTPGTTFLQVEEAIYAELELLAREPVTADELRRVKSANRKGTTLASADPQSFANMLCQAEASATWRWFVEYDDKFDAVTPRDVMRVANTYFSRDNRTVGHFIPTEKEATQTTADAAASVASSQVDKRKRSSAKQKAPGKPVRMKLAKPAQAPVPFAERVTREVLPNGLTLMFMPNPGTGSVSIQGITFAGPYFGRDKLTVAGCVSQMMTKGSKGHSKFELAELLEEMGARFNFAPDRFRVNFSTLVVKDDFGRFVPVLADVLRNPLFLDAELTATKRELAAGIKRAMNSTGERARQALYQALFPGDHPFFDVSYPERLAALEKISVEDLRQFHGEHYSPQSTIIAVVGDISEGEAMEALRAAFGDWTGAARKPIQVPVVDTANGGKRFEVTLADKASVDIVLGAATPVGRSASDFFAAYLANAALGQDTISARLGKVLRVREGLTYGIYSYFDDTSFGGAPWQVSISVNPQNVERSIALINEVLADYLKKGITQDELEDEAGRAVGSFTVQLRTSAGIAGTLAKFESMGLGVCALDTLAQDFTSVTRAQANEALRKYFRPENLTLAMAGTLLTPRPASELATSKAK
jgi:zinc protease